MSGLELTALTNSLMGQSSLFVVIVVWLLLHRVYPGLNRVLVWVLRLLSFGPLGLTLHRWFWNWAIFTGAEAEHGLGYCDRGDAPLEFCRYGGWFLDNSAWLVLPIVVGALGMLAGIRLLQAERSGLMITLFFALQVPAAILSVWWA